MQRVRHPANDNGPGKVRTALALLSIAFVFFVGVIANRVLFG
jgi:hypothetical protein